MIRLLLRQPGAGSSVVCLTRTSRYRSKRRSWSVPLLPTNAPCVHGCGYLHLLSSMPGMRKKCCANGRLSSASNNFEEELMMDHELNQLPNFLRLLITSCCGFSQKSSTYNNLVAMAATVVCNYNITKYFTWHGHRPQSVFMNGRVHHYMRIASSTMQNWYIIFHI
jgi:hypothetical protein